MPDLDRKLPTQVRGSARHRPRSGRFIFPGENERRRGATSATLRRLSSRLDVHYGTATSVNKAAHDQFSSSQGDKGEMKTCVGILTATVTLRLALDVNQPQYGQYVIAFISQWLTSDNPLLICPNTSLSPAAGCRLPPYHPPLQCHYLPLPPHLHL